MRQKMQKKRVQKPKLGPAKRARKRVRGAFQGRRTSRFAGIYIYIFIFVPIYIHIYLVHIFAYRFSRHRVGHSERSFKKNIGNWRRAMWEISRPVHFCGSRGGAGAPYQRITTMQKSGTKSFEPCHFVQSQSPPTKKNSNKVTAFCGRSETTEKSS